MTSITDHCARCRRPAPPMDSDEFVHWEAHGDTIICPNCITGGEQQAMDEMDMETEEAIRRNEKTRETRLRRMAKRQGLDLHKSRARDPRAISYGGWMISDLYTNGAVAGYLPEYSMDLDEVEEFLTTPREDR